MKPSRGLTGRAAPQVLDGGWAWVVAAASCFAQFFTCGFAYSTGVYYVIFLDVFSQSTGLTAWISSLNFGVLCAVGPIASCLINNVSCRFTVFVGGIIASLGLACSSFATEIYTLFFTFGILTGAGFGLVFTSSVVVISEYFVKYRVVAMGLSISGSGLGTIVYPWLSRGLLGHYGWRGALLISSAINLHVCIVALLLRPNHKPPCKVKLVNVSDDVVKSKNDFNNISKSPVKLEGGKQEVILERTTCAKLEESKVGCKIPEGAFTNSRPTSRSSQDVKVNTGICLQDLRRDLGVDIFCDLTFILLCINTFLFCFAISVMYTHIAAYAASLQFAQSSRDLLISCIGFTNLIGRVALGSAAQFLPVQVTWLFIISYFLAGVGVLFCAVWITFPGLMVSVCIFGFFSAGFGPLLSEVTCLTVGVMKFSIAYGYLMVFMAIGTVVGAPVAGTLYDNTQYYQASFYLAGLCLLTSAVIMVPDVLPINGPKSSKANRPGHTDSQLPAEEEETLVEARISTV